MCVPSTLTSISTSHASAASKICLCSRREYKQILDAALARDVETLVGVLGTHITKGAEMYAEHEATAQGQKARRKVK